MDSSARSSDDSRQHVGAGHEDIGNHIALTHAKVPATKTGGDDLLSGTLSSVSAMLQQHFQPQTARALPAPRMDWEQEDPAVTVQPLKEKELAIPAMASLASHATTVAGGDSVLSSPPPLLIPRHRLHREVGCVSFGDDPRAPPDTTTKVPDATASPYRAACRLTVRFPGDDGNTSTWRRCTGALIGAYHLLTASYCTYDPCRGGDAAEVIVACGYDAASSPYHPTGYAHYGTARVISCWRDPLHDVAGHCAPDGRAVPKTNSSHVQVCRLDRSLVHLLGHFAIELDAKAVLGNVPLALVGYPDDARLDLFLPEASQRMLHHSAIDAVVADNGLLVMDNVWSFEGEIGGPMHQLNPLGGLHAMAVYLGEGGGSSRESDGSKKSQASGCVRYAQALTPAWVRSIAPLRSGTVWPGPSPHCQIVQLDSDIFALLVGNDDRALQGVRRGTTTGSAWYRTTTLGRSGGAVSVRGAIFNVGSKAATNITVRVVASPSPTLAEPIVLQDVYLQALSSRAQYLLTQTVVANLPRGAYYLGFVWSASGCLTDDAQFLVAGEVAVAQAPLANGSLCALAVECASRSCLSRRCCAAASAQVVACVACDSEGFCAACGPARRMANGTCVADPQPDSRDLKTYTSTSDQSVFTPGVIGAMCVGVVVLFSILAFTVTHCVRKKSIRGIQFIAADRDDDSISEFCGEAGNDRNTVMQPGKSAGGGDAAFTAPTTVFFQGALASTDS